MSLGAGERLEYSYTRGSKPSDAIQNTDYGHEQPPFVGDECRYNRTNDRENQNARQSYKDNVWTYRISTNSSMPVDSNIKDSKKQHAQQAGYFTHSRSSTVLYTHLRRLCLTAGVAQTSEHINLKNLGAPGLASET